MKNNQSNKYKIIKTILLFSCTFSVHSQAIVKTNKSSPKKEIEINEQHDGLYDPDILEKYNSHRNVKGVALEDYYAPIYFRNLKNNFGNNLYGTCNYVAMGMLLSFWDTYWDDSIIPENYEMGPIFFNGTFTEDTDSPGIRKEFGPIFENLSGFDEFKALRETEWILNSFYQIKLIDMWDEYISNLQSDDLTMSIDNMSRFLSNHFYYDLGFNRSDFRINYCKTSDFSSDESVRDFIISNVTQGIPVLVGIGHDSSSDYGSHTAIAYDYDIDKDEIYVNMGWGNNASHIAIETLDYSSYNNALTICPLGNWQHSHTDNYKAFSFNGFSSYCSCEYMKPFAIEEIREEVDDETEITFKWKSLKNEKWNDYHNTPLNYNFSVSYYDDFNLVNLKSVSGHSYTLSQNEANALLQCSHYEAHVDYVHGDCTTCANTIFTKSFPHDVTDNYMHEVNPEDYGLSESSSFTSTINRIFEFDYSVNYQLDFKLKNARYNGSTITLIGSTDSYIEYYLSSYFIRIDYDITGDFYIYHKRSNGVWAIANEGKDYQLNHDETSDCDYIEFFSSFRHIRIVPKSVFFLYVGSITIWNKLPTSGYELPYDPSLWNYSPVQENVNCYGYAINNQLDPNFDNFLWNFQQPGYYAYYENWTRVPFMTVIEPYIKRETVFARRDFEKYSLDTGKEYIFEEVGRFDSCEEGTYKVAFVYSGNYSEYDWGGYHWYRQNPDGTWSHKDGNNPCTDLDCSNKKICDPQLADRGSYDLFITYYKITPWNNIYYIGD